MASLVQLLRNGRQANSARIGGCHVENDDIYACPDTDLTYFGVPPDLSASNKVAVLNSSGLIT